MDLSMCLLIDTYCLPTDYDLRRRPKKKNLDFNSPVFSKVLLKSKLELIALCLLIGLVNE